MLPVTMSTAASTRVSTSPFVLVLSLQVLKRLGLVYESNRQNLDSAFECYRRVRELYMKHLGHMDSRTREAMG